MELNEHVVGRFRSWWGIMWDIIYNQPNTLGGYISKPLPFGVIKHCWLGNPPLNDSFGGF